MKRSNGLMLAVAILLNACRGEQPIEARNIWVRSASQGETTAVYMILYNGSKVADELIAVTSDSAEAVEIHESSMGKDGIMRMVPQPLVPLKAGEKVEFKTGGLHIMMMGLRQDLAPGEEISITLHFKNAGDMTMVVPVRDAAEIDNSGVGHQNMP